MFRKFGFQKLLGFPTSDFYGGACVKVVYGLH